MKQKTKLTTQTRPGSVQQSNLPKIRIRSCSRDKFLTTTCKSRQKSTDKVQNDEQAQRNSMTQRLKIPHKELKKLLVQRRHQRKQSSDIYNYNCIYTQNSSGVCQKNDPMNFESRPFMTQHINKKLVYEMVRTEQSQANPKMWIDVNSIDTAEDIKILDRIANMCDPFRIIEECSSKHRLQKKSQEPRVKSISVKKSKLTDKINTLVFDIVSKSKSKPKNNNYFQKNKLETPFNPPKESNQGQHTSASPEGQTNVFKKYFQTPKLSQRKVNSPYASQKKGEISSQRCDKMLLFPKSPRHLISGIPTTKVTKINVKQMKENKKNDMMDKFWSGVNESLILAAQEEYVSKDLNQLLHNNMI